MVQALLTYEFGPPGGLKEGQVRDGVVFDNYGDRVGLIDQTTNTIELAGEKLPLDSESFDGGTRLSFTNGMGVKFYIEERR